MLYIPRVLLFLEVFSTEPLGNIILLLDHVSFIKNFPSYIRNLCLAYRKGSRIPWQG